MGARGDDVRVALAPRPPETRRGTVHHPAQRPLRREADARFPLQAPVAPACPRRGGAPGCGTYAGRGPSSWSPHLSRRHQANEHTQGRHRFTSKPPVSKVTPFREAEGLPPGPECGSLCWRHRPGAWAPRTAWGNCGAGEEPGGVWKDSGRKGRGRAGPGGARRLELEAAGPWRWGWGGVRGGRLAAQFGAQ